MDQSTVPKRPTPKPFVASNHTVRNTARNTARVPGQPRGATT